MGAPASGSVPDGDGLAADRLFRFGFLCAALDSEPDPARFLAGRGGGWGRVEVGELVVHHHPETRLRRRSRGADMVLAIGEVFAADGDPDAALDRLLEAGADTQGDADRRFFDALDSLSGRFALIVVRGSRRWVLHDPIGSRSLYYRLGDQPCVASHAELVALAFGHGPSPEAEAVVESEEFASRSVKYLPGDLTLHDGVVGLAPNNLLELGSNTTTRYWPREPRVRGSFDEFAAALDSHLRALANHLRAAHRPVLGVTGGIDTRVIISAFSRDAARFEGVTWLRRSGLEPAELEVIDALVAAGGFEHSYVDLSENTPDRRRLAALAKRNAGGFGPRSRITGHFGERFGDTEAAFVRGYGAEIMRGFYNLPTGTSSAAGGGRSLRARIGRRLGRGRRRPIAVGHVAATELLRAYDSSMGLNVASAEHERVCGAAFERFIERANLTDEIAGRGYDLSDVFYWEHRMGMWGASNLNELDPALLAIAGFNSRVLYSAAFGLEPEERLTKELLRGAIAREDEAMASIPYV